jgi:hypothetical protein
MNDLMIRMDCDEKRSVVVFFEIQLFSPQYPRQRSGGNAPGWWFGIEPAPAADLIQV